MLSRPHACITARMIPGVNLVAAAYKTGHIRLLRPADLSLAVEICAHAKTMTALDVARNRVGTGLPTLLLSYHARIAQWKLEIFTHNYADKKCICTIMHQRLLIRRHVGGHSALESGMYSAGFLSSFLVLDQLPVTRPAGSKRLSSIDRKIKV